MARARACASQRARGPGVAAAKAEAKASPAQSRKRSAPEAGDENADPSPVVRRASLRGAADSEQQLDCDEAPVRYAKRVKRARLANQAREAKGSPSILGVQVAPTPA